MLVHGMALPPAAAKPLAAEAAVAGPKRTLPGVKHSQWVADRSSVAVTDSRFSFASIMWMSVHESAGCGNTCNGLQGRIVLMCRRKLMPNMPESAAEGLLCNSDGQLLEGFVTNLFVVAGTGFSRSSITRSCAYNATPIRSADL